MPAPAKSTAFNKSRAHAIAGSIDGAHRGVPYCENIVAVNSDGRHAVQLPCAVNVVTYAPLRQMQVTRIEVVLADKQHRQPVQSRDIQCFVKVTFLGCAVAKERNGDSAIVAYFRCQRRTRCQRNRSGDQRHGSKYPDLWSTDVHRASASLRASSRTAKDFRHQSPDIAALGDVMSVRPVTSPYVVLAIECGTDAGCDGFLTYIEVAGSLYFASSHMVGDGLLKTADENHSAVHPPQQRDRQIAVWHPDSLNAPRRRIAGAFS